ncbi:hypothetical protein CBA19C8_01500 [Paraburkholderia terrae]|nr:hypothetical protein CBA19C8_01500 [Paraburkholderia terrae]
MLEAVAPTAVVHDDGDKARQTLNRWTRLGLFLDDAGVIDVAERPDDRLRTPHDMLAFTRRQACARVLAPENNPDFWAPQGTLAADLTRGLAWMLAQDVYRTGFDDIEERESQQIADPDRWLLRNGTRKPGLQFWSRFLGFSRQPYADIDPTVAVRDVLPQVIAEGEDMPVAQFVDRLAAVLPVIDDGVWRREMLTSVDMNILGGLTQGQLSTALSRALLNLRLAGDIHLTVRSDLGSAIVLTGANGARNDLTFHWIARPKAGDSR